MHLFGYIGGIAYFCDEEKIDKEFSRTASIGKLISLFLIPRHRSCHQWRAAPFGVCFARRITKVAKHSNPVIRSFITSTVRLFLL